MSSLFLQNYQLFFVSLAGMASTAILVDKTAIHIQVNPQNVRIFAFIIHGIINKIMEVNLSGKVVLVMGVGKNPKSAIMVDMSAIDIPS